LPALVALMLQAAAPHISESFRYVFMRRRYHSCCHLLSDDDTKTKDVVLNFENIKIDLAARFHRIWPSKQISFGCYEINIKYYDANGILVKIPCLSSPAPP